jgi:hypothetical protein
MFPFKFTNRFGLGVFLVICVPRISAFLCFRNIVTLVKSNVPAIETCTPGGAESTKNCKLCARDEILIGPESGKSWFSVVKRKRKEF